MTQLERKLERGQYLVRTAASGVARMTPAIEAAPLTRMLEGNELTVPVNDRVVGFEALFVRDGVAGTDSYGFMYDPGWLTAGAGAVFLGRGHDWQDMPLGAGRVEMRPGSHGGNEYWLRGELRSSALTEGGEVADATVRDFLRVWNVSVRNGVAPEVSMGFFARDWRETSDEEKDRGAGIAITEGDLVEVSYVFRGAVPETSLSLEGRSMVYDDQAGDIAFEEGDAGVSLNASDESFVRADERLRFFLLEQEAEALR